MRGESYEDIIARLEQIGDELGERSIALLREAVESGAGQRPAEEKVLSQARRAIDKAISLLGRGPVTDD